MSIPSLQLELSLRVRLLFDRQELRELLASLSSDGYLKIKYDDDLQEKAHSPSVDVEFGALGEYEARKTYWFVSNAGEPWYRV
jgi:hypothetical protein